MGKPSSHASATCNREFFVIVIVIFPSIREVLMRPQDRTQTSERIPSPLPRREGRGQGEVRVRVRRITNGQAPQNVRPSWGRDWTARPFEAHRFFEAGIQEFPLPGGEGQGEGKRDVTNPNAPINHPDSVRLQLSDSQACWHFERHFPLTPPSPPGRGRTFARLGRDWTARPFEAHRFVRTRDSGVPSPLPPRERRGYPLCRLCPILRPHQ